MTRTSTMVASLLRRSRNTKVSRYYCSRPSRSRLFRPPLTRPASPRPSTFPPSTPRPLANLDPLDSLTQTSIPYLPSLSALDPSISYPPAAQTLQPTTPLSALHTFVSQIPPTPILVPSDHSVPAHTSSFPPKALQRFLSCTQPIQICTSITPPLPSPASPASRLTSTSRPRSGWLFVFTAARRLVAEAFDWHGPANDPADHAQTEAWIDAVSSPAPASAAGLPSAYAHTLATFPTECNAIGRHIDTRALTTAFVPSPIFAVPSRSSRGHLPLYLPPLPAALHPAMDATHTSSAHHRRHLQWRRQDPRYATPRGTRVGGLQCAPVAPAASVPAHLRFRLLDIARCVVHTHGRLTLDFMLLRVSGTSSSHVCFKHSFIQLVLECNRLRSAHSWKRGGEARTLEHCSRTAGSRPANIPYDTRSA